MTQAASKLLLPYYGSQEDVERIVQYLRTKPTGASESDLSRTLSTKFVDPRKFDFYDLIGFFKRANGTYRLSERGLEYLRADDGGKRELYRDAIRSFMPYHAILDWAFHNEVASLEADTLKHEWASKFDQILDLTNDYRLTAAPTAFFAILEMAGLGIFVVGRRGSKSRIEFNLRELERYLNVTVGGGGGAINNDVNAENPPAGTENNIPPSTANPQRNPAPQGPLGGFTFNVPVMGKVAKLTWPEPTMTQAEWEKFKRVGDAMFLD